MGFGEREDSTGQTQNKVREYGFVAHSRDPIIPCTCRYKDCIECDRIVVYGVRNRQNVSSFRTAFPSTQFLEIMEKVSSTEVNLTPWTAQGSDQKGPSRRNTKHVIETGAKPDQLLEETDERKELTKSEARRLKKDKRKREWEELLKIKPGDNFEDPREVEAIEKAKREMGDYKLKSSSDFVVSEDQRTSTDKKRKELVLCRNTVSTCIVQYIIHCTCGLIHVHVDHLLYLSDS